MEQIYLDIGDINVSISTKLEYWNEAPDPSDIHIITHYISATENIYYEFLIDGTHLSHLGHENTIPNGFLKFPNADYYEFAGPLNRAKETLTNHGFTLIIKGDDW